MISTLKNLRPIWWATIAGSLFFTVLVVPFVFSKAGGGSPTSEGAMSTENSIKKETSQLLAASDVSTVSFQPPQNLSSNTKHKPELDADIADAEKQQLEDEIEMFRDQKERLEGVANQQKKSLVASRQMNAVLEKELSELKRRIENDAKIASESDELAGNWKLQVDVESLASPKFIRPVNWIVEYDVCLHVQNGTVTGAIYGATDLQKDFGEQPSRGGGRISGTFINGRLDFKVGGPSKGPVSRYTLDVIDGRLVGRLEADSLAVGWNAYVGTVKGRKTESP